MAIITDLFNSVPHLKADFKRDWKETSKKDWKTDFNSISGGLSPMNTVLPAITGTVRVGQTLTASTGTWTGTPGPTYTYQWKRAGVAISAATASTYVLVHADAGLVITVTVTATNTTNVVGATSAATIAVLEIPANTVAPVASGSLVRGAVLSVTTGTWNGYLTPVFTYQWHDGTANVSGATASTYTTLVGDVGKSFHCLVTGTNASGAATVSSNTIGPIT